MDKDKTKNNIIIILIVIIILLLSLFVTTDNSNNDLVESTDTPETTEPTDQDVEDLFTQAEAESNSVNVSEQKEYTEITIDEYMDYLAGTEQKIILIGSPTCSYCDVADPIIKNVAYIYDLEINYLDTSKFINDDEATFVKSATLFNEGYGTPTLFTVQNNSVNDALEGLTISEVYIEFFTNNGYIK